MTKLEFLKKLKELTEAFELQGTNYTKQVIGVEVIFIDTTPNEFWRWNGEEFVRSNVKEE